MSKRDPRHTLTLATVIAVVSAILVSGAGIASAADLQKVSVRMDWVAGAYHAPFYAGVKNGFFKEQGLNVTVEPGNGSANVAQGISHGTGECAPVAGGW